MFICRPGCGRLASGSLSLRPRLHNCFDTSVVIGRSSILQGDKKCYVDGDLGSRLTLPDCHVLGSKGHCEVGSSSRKKLFELHEILKSIPRLGKEGKSVCSRIEPNVSSSTSGIWDFTDDRKPAGDGQLITLVVGNKELYDEAIPVFDMMGKAMAFELCGALAGSLNSRTGENVKPACGGEDGAFLKKVISPICATIAGKLKEAT